MFFLLGFPLFLLGVGCIVLLFMLPAEGAKLGLPPDVLKKWRSARQMTYISGLVACWGSGFIGFIVFVVVSLVTTSCYDYGYGYGRYCDSGSGVGAFFMQFLVTLVVLGGAGAFAFMQFQKSQAIAAPYKTAKPAYGQPPAASGWGQPSAYPPPPPAPGQPGAYPPPPAGPGSGQPPAPPQPWNQPPAAAQPWNQPPAAAQPSNQPPAAAQPWNQPPAAPVDPAAPPKDPNTGAPKA